MKSRLIIGVTVVFGCLFLHQCHLYQNHNMNHKFNFYTEYHQFYLEDKEKKEEINSSNFWSEEASNSKLAMAHGIIGINTHSYGNIKGDIEILDKPKENINYELYDHIVEGGINIESGELQILDCPTSQVEISLKVSPGKYRIRVYGSNFTSVKEADLANDTDNDYYKIEIWKSENMERKVLKQWNSK
jgi:hypothetical protein